MTSHYADTLRRLRARIANTPERKVVRMLDSWITMLDAAPEKAQQRIAAAIQTVRPELAGVLAAWTEELCPAYPQASREHRARITLGEKPAQILRGLTPREAHAALSDGYSTAIGWILDDAGLSTAFGSVSSVSVARWLAACWRDLPRRVALETERVEQIAGTEVRGTLLSRVDEIRAADLTEGMRTGVRPAFERAAARLYAEWERRSQDDHDVLAPVPKWWRPARCAQLLRTRAALVAEGRAMHHCVGTYAPHVAERRSVIVSIAIRVGTQTYRSTVELDPRTADVRQHKGAGNAEPHVLCWRALDVLRRRWQEAAR